MIKKRVERAPYHIKKHIPHSLAFGLWGYFTWGRGFRWNGFFWGGGRDLIRSRRIFMATLNALEAVDCVNIDIECLNTTYTQQEKSLWRWEKSNFWVDMYRKTAIVMTLNNKLRGASSYSEAFSIVKKIIDDSEQFPRGCVVVHLLLQNPSIH